jgi:hypothetical protein
VWYRAVSGVGEERGEREAAGEEGHARDALLPFTLPVLSI